MITILVGKRIRYIRLSQGLSQEKLALIANVDRTYLAGVESGKRNISLINLEKIILALGTTFKDFFSEVDANVELHSK